MLGHLLDRLWVALRHTPIVPRHQRTAVVRAAVRQRRKSLPTVDTLDRHTAVADQAAFESIAMQTLRLIEAKDAPSAVYHHFAGQG